MYNHYNFYPRDISRSFGTKVYPGFENTVFEREVKTVAQHSKVVICDRQTKAGAGRTARRRAFDERLLEIFDISDHIGSPVGDRKARGIYRYGDLCIRVRVGAAISEEVFESLSEKLRVGIDKHGRAFDFDGKI